MIELTVYAFFRISESEDAAKIVHLNLFPNLRFFPPYRRVNEKSKNYMELLRTGRDWYYY